MIRTFADCPDREEHWKGENGYGCGDSYSHLCPDGSHLALRNQDYSICKNPDREFKSHACQIGRGSKVDVDTKWCEAALCAHCCPRGFVR